MNQFLVGEGGTVSGIETALRIAQLDGWNDIRLADGIVASLWWGQYHQRVERRIEKSPKAEEVDFLEFLQAELGAGRILSSGLERRRVQKAIDEYASGTDVHCPKLESASAKY